MEHVQVHCVYNPEKAVFEFSICSFVNKGDNKGSFACNLTPDQFLAMAQYLGKVGVSYQGWLKNGGQPPKV